LCRNACFISSTEQWRGFLEYLWRRTPFSGDCSSRIRTSRQVSGESTTASRSPLSESGFCEWTIPWSSFWNFGDP
jgi:hypothetical protein